MSKKDSKPDKNTTLHLSAGATTIAGSTARMTVSVRGPLPENHELYAIIGRVAAAWAHLEHMLDLIIWDLASISPDKGACITGQLMGASPRYHVILTLSMTHGMKEQTLRVIRKLMRKTMDVNEERNRIVHDAWYLESPSGKTFQFRSMMPKKIQHMGLKK